MLSSISPLGEQARRQHFSITATSYLAGSTASGALLGGTLGTLGRGLPRDADQAFLLTVAAIACVGLLADRGTFGWHVPGPRRQVNEDWLARYRGWVYGGGFGLQLGFGFATIVSTSITYLAFGCALLTASATSGLVIGALFGATRALPILTTARLRDWQQLREFMASLQRRLPLVRRAVLVAHVATIGGTLGWAAERVSG